MMGFESLLYEISSKFVNLPASEVDQEINDAIRQIVEFLGIDQSVFGEFRDDGNTLQISHGYTNHIWPETPGIILNSIVPNIIQKLKKGEVVNLSRLPEDIPAEWKEEHDYAMRVGLKSCVSVSLRIGGSVLGVIIFESYRKHQNWTEQSIQHMRLLAQIFANALERKQTDIKLKKAFKKIHELSEHLKAENRYLREAIISQTRYENIIGKSGAIREVIGSIEQVAGTDSTVLLLGETGTGKTMFAQLLHMLSKCRKKTMIKVNCAAVPANLLESEFFGHEKGAFTGATSRKIGRFEIASGSTLFLDEIGELPLDLQAKLLRVLDDGEFERVGSSFPVKVNVRIIAATNRDLHKMVQEGKFRSDLFYRLNVYPIHIPALRARPEDIPDMIWAFVKNLSKTMNRNIENISEKDMESAISYNWPGNIRELKNVVENAMISSKGGTLNLRIPKPNDMKEKDSLAFSDAERDHIISVLKRTRGKVKGPEGAAELLMLKPSTLYSKMKKLGISVTAESF